MPLTVETVASLEAAEDRLVAAVGAFQHDPLERVNVLTGSNLQRLYLRRLIARVLGASANVRFFTPVDLAVAIRNVAGGPPRQALPDGADTLVMDGVLRDLRRRGALRRLDPDVSGVAEAAASALKDLREGAVSVNDYADALRRNDDPKLRDLSAIYAEFESQMAPFGDRTSLYEDALDARLPDSALREALGDAPLLVTGLYDAPAVQIQMLARCAEVVGVRVLLVAAEEPEFTFAQGFRRALIQAGATAVEPDADPTEFEQRTAYSYFSAPSRQAEAEEIVRRILALAHDQAVPFGEMAVLHRLDHSADDLLCAALERAGVPVYRAAGRPLRHTAGGRAILVLLELMTQPPQRHRLLEFIASPALASEIPPGVRAKPVLWERHSKQAGIVEGWDRFRTQLQQYIGRLRSDERSGFARDTAEELRAVVERLADAAAEIDSLSTWHGYSDWFSALIDAYLAADVNGSNTVQAVRDRIQALAQLDEAGIAVDGERFRTAAARAVRRTVLNDTGALSGAVFVGNVSAARSLRFEAVFLAECAERIFPPLVRQDPLLLDGERERLNARLKRAALPIKRDRQDEEQMLFRLVEQSARSFLTISWARRTNSTGAPKLPSHYLLRSVPHEIEELATVDSLYANGTISKLPTRLAGAAPVPAAVTAGDWTSTSAALDESDFRLAVLEGAGPRGARQVLSRLWDGYGRYETARRGRNGDQFSEWDGVLAPDAVAEDPFSRSMSPTALEDYATCPYRYYLKQVLRVGAVPEPGEALEMSPLDRGSMVHRILERWVQEGLKHDGSWAEFLEDESRLTEIAEEEFAAEKQGGLAGLPATWAIVQAEVRADLRELIRIERRRAAEGYRPVDAELIFKDLPLTMPDGRRLTFGGRIDRVDEGPDGYVAIDYKTGRASKEAGDYVSGAALQLPIYLQAVAQEYNVEAASVASEYWYATRRGEFTRSGLRGADVLNDAHFWDALGVITDGIGEGRFFPHPGEARGDRRRPNCTYCDYLSVCSTDVDARFDHKKRLDQSVVRDFLAMQAQK